MTFTQYKLAGTYNMAASLVNVETYTTFPPRANPLPLGSTAEITLDGAQQINGAQIVEWRWGFLPKSKLNSLVTTFIGSYDIASAPVTMMTRKRDESWGTFNAMMHLPVEGQDYEQPTLGTVTDLRIKFYVTGTAT